MVSKTVAAYMAQIGRKGGKAGSGAKKRRAPEHYARLAELRRARKKERTTR